MADRFSRVNQTPSRVLTPARMLSSKTEAAADQAEALVLTDSCVKRLKQICDEDNSYLRVLVT